MSHQGIRQLIDDQRADHIQQDGPQPEAEAPSTLQSSSPRTPTHAPRRRVDHTYRDYSNYPLNELPETKTTNRFPSKLHEILSTPEHESIISWMPHGRAWKIHDKDLLIRDVAPKYFIQKKYESFTRQLNGWGFKRLHQPGNDSNAYYHECFLRGLPHLTVLMSRVSPKKGKLLPDVEGEPNFYEIDKQFPLPHRLTVPHHGHYQLQHHLSHHPMASSNSNGHGSPPVGYHGSSHYSLYPPPPPPSSFGHDGGLVMAPSAMQPGYYPYYSSHHHNPYPGHYPSQHSYPPTHDQYPPYPYHSGHPNGAPPHQFNNFSLSVGPLKSEEVPAITLAEHHDAANEGTVYPRGRKHI